MMASDKKIRLNTGRSLSDFVSGVFEEGIKSALHRKSLTEKEKQDSVVSASQNGSNSQDGSSDGSGDDEEGSNSSKTMDDEQEKLASGEDIKPKDIVDKLNSIRSGRSFKDSSVSSSMEEYIQSLSNAERVALLAFLKGIAQIVTGEISANQAEEPGEHPSDVHMDKSNEPKTFHKKPNVIKGSPAGNSKKSSGGAEDTSAPAPIVPKKR